MIQTGNGFGFSLEALFPDRVIGKFFRQDLYGHGAPQPCVASTVHFSHSTRAERRFNLIRP
jgi:hypothetical protein